MGALVAALTPRRFKKQRLSSRAKGDEENDSDAEIEEVKYEESVWTQSRQVLLQSLTDRMKTVKALVQQMEPAVKQRKLDADMAQASSDDANDQAGLAHAGNDYVSAAFEDQLRSTTELVVELLRQPGQRLAFELNNLSSVAELLERTEGGRLGGSFRAHRCVVLD